MRRALELIERVLPALVMAAGVMLLTAGLIAYAPSAFGEQPSPDAGVAGDPLFGASPPLQTAAPGGSGNAFPTATPIDIGTEPPPTAGPTPAPGRAVASRIRIPSLRIDLPVVSGELVVPGNVDNYPLCDVAMYMPTFVQPGELGTTYIYAHAQRGMFLPLLRESTEDDGAGMIGSLIEVYTTTNELHIYEIVRVKRHATDLSIATEATDMHQLVLQTSEGPAGTVEKLQVAARPVSVIDSTPIEAMPQARPRACAPRG